MNKNLLTIVVLMLAMAVGAAAQQAQPVDTTSNRKAGWPSFLTGDQRPNGTLYLPPPPAFESQAFVADIVAYHQAKALRDTPRGKQAIFDAGLTTQEIMEGVSPYFGLTLSEQGTPQTYLLLQRVVTDGSGATSKIKRHYKRLRPFLFFNEPTLIPEEEASHHTPSYPSSHASTGWTVALVLVELNPGRQEAILKWGYDYGQSRVIAGYHYQSDVDAGRLAASAVVARLHADEAFQKQLGKARKELAKLLKALDDKEEQAE